MKETPSRTSTSSTFPPYAPDNNPIEHVWNEAKNRTSNHQHPTFTDTRHAFETYIKNNTFPYRINKKDLV